MTNVSVDTHELRAFAADLTRLPGELSRHAIPVVEKGAHNIKKQMQAELDKSSNLGIRKVAATVTYDVARNGDNDIEAEIGPDKDLHGNLANIAYFGTWKGGGHTPDPVGALEAEIPNFEGALGDLVEELWG